MTDAQYQQFREALIANGNHREAAALALQRHLGLRQAEAVRSHASLATWERQLQHAERITVSLGTKGGRPRETRVPDREAALAAIREAREAAGNGPLIHHENLRGALTRLSWAYRSIGMTGRQSSHAARYAFAQQRMEAYRAEGFTEREARAMTSLDLGHGDGRGRYIAMVYGR